MTDELAIEGGQNWTPIGGQDCRPFDIGVDLGAAMIAAPQVSAEGFGATRENVGDGASVRRQDRRAMRRQIVVREAAKDVRDLDHD